MLPWGYKNQQTHVSDRAGTKCVLGAAPRFSTIRLYNSAAKHSYLRPKIFGVTFLFRCVAHRFSTTYRGNPAVRSIRARHKETNPKIPMEYEDIMKRLIQCFVRKFYETPHIILMDILLRKLVMFDFELYAALKIIPKEFSKIAFKLREDKIIKQETKIESRENNYQELRQVFYVNYGEVRDVIKYKIFKMTKKLESEMGKAEEVFVCSTCRKEFGILDAQALMTGFTFKCDECQGSLEESRRVIENDPHNLYEKLMKNMKDLIDMLKLVDKYSIPSFDYFQVLSIRRDRESSSHSKSQRVPKEDTKVSEEVVEEDINFEDPPGKGERGICNTDGGKEERDADKRLQGSEVCDVLVQGVRKPFSSITEADKEAMTEDEYEIYFEVSMRQNKGGQDSRNF